ncbi:hotdog domain-containing protein [Isosphaeraceae bacterium EP7]
MTYPSARPASESRSSLAIWTDPKQANVFGSLHGGVILHLADECGALAVIRHVGSGKVATAAIDSLIFLAPVVIGERLDLQAEVTWVGRTSAEARIEVFAEPLARAGRRKVAEGYALYVSFDEGGTPQVVPPLVSETEADRRRDEAAETRQVARLARRAEAKRG